MHFFRIPLLSFSKYEPRQRNSKAAKAGVTRMTPSVRPKKTLK